MAIFPPPERAVTVVVDGRRLDAYLGAYVQHGRVMAPVDPFLTQFATKISYDGKTLVVMRGERFAQVALTARPSPLELQWTYVPVAPLLVTLGAAVRYDPLHRVLEVRPPRSPIVATPTPFNPAVPQVEPTTLFTPIPVPTPRPVFTGKPVPRRTPLPFEPAPSPSPRS
ncbi:MAG: hypothetical protein JO165_03160 [Candidatus Eremiobacteraeota bacterium]|nr:hypothetical protein [Candidatus Eremiobacteraeota bacterium]